MVTVILMVSMSESMNWLSPESKNRSLELLLLVLSLPLLLLLLPALVVLVVVLPWRWARWVIGVVVSEDVELVSVLSWLLLLADCDFSWPDAVDELSVLSDDDELLLS